MSSFQGSPFSVYSTSALYDEITNSPLDYPYYTSGESSSGTFIRDQVASSLQACLPSDLPDLYDDQNWPSPHSATSSNLISTPPPEWQTPWHSIESQGIPDDTKYRTSSRQGTSISPPKSMRPTVAPIDTDCNRENYQHMMAECPSMLFTSLSSFRGTQQLHPHTASFYQPCHDINVSPSKLAPSHSADLSPHSSATTHPSLTLHQPRPFRRIPIVSLSKLASACDAESSSRVSDRDFISPASKPSFASTVHPSTRHVNTQYFYPSNNTYRSTSGNRAQVIMCPCGCMELYTFR